MNQIQVNLAVQDKSLLQRWEQYKLGIDFYRAGEPVMRCASAEQLRGWYDSQRAEAEANTPGYAQKMGW